ncbi:MAG: ester cyclase, partial [Gemmatimonadota bacterium]
MTRKFVVGLFLLGPVAAGVDGCSDRDALAPDATPPVFFAAQPAFGHPSGSEAQMQQVVRDQWIELLNTGDLAIADEIYADDLLPHIPHHPHVTDLASYKQVTVAATHQVIADFHAAIDDLFAHGDKVVGRFTATGLMGGRVPYTNTWIIVFRFEDGAIAEEWWQFDLLGVQQQLGAIPGSRPTYTWGEPSTVTGDPGHAPKNQGLVRRAEQVWETGNMVQADDVFSADFVNHDPVLPGVTDRESFKESV